MGSLKFTRFGRHHVSQALAITSFDSVQSPRYRFDDSQSEKGGGAKGRTRKAVRRGRAGAEAQGRTRREAKEQERQGGRGEGARPERRSRRQAAEQAGAACEHWAETRSRRGRAGGRRQVVDSQLIKHQWYKHRPQ